MVTQCVHYEKGWLLWSQGTEQLHVQTEKRNRVRLDPRLVVRSLTLEGGPEAIPASFLRLQIKCLVLL